VAVSDDEIVASAPRRYRRSTALAALILLVIVAIAVIHRGHTSRVTSAASTPRLRPQSLAAGPNGSLYVADPSVNTIYQRSPTGAFRVVAGTGVAGYSGDGGRANQAELDNPEGMIVEPDGALLVADAGNNRIRKITPAGIISTVAGNGSAGVVTAAGSAASRPINQPQDVDVDPAGGYDIATSSQLLHVDSHGIITALGGNVAAGLVGIGGPAVSGSMDVPNGVAVDNSGGIFVAGSASKALLYITSGHTLTALDQAFYPRGSGGLRRAPDGSIVAMNGWQILRYHGTTATVVHDFGTGLEPNGLAVTADGDIWVSTFTGDGSGNESALARIDKSGQVTVVWHGPAE
jgi:sugar lactone lactonase YvrE